MIHFISRDFQNRNFYLQSWKEIILNFHNEVKIDKLKLKENIIFKDLEKPRDQNYLYYTVELKKNTFFSLPKDLEIRNYN